MLSSITPLGERGRSARWSRTVTYYLIGSVLGGALIGLAAGVLGDLALALVPLPLWGRLAIVAVAATAGALLDTDRWRALLPTNHRQVNEDWLHSYRPWVYGGGFGFQLGLGVVTIVTTAAVYLLLLVMALAGSWWVGLVLGVTFGLARALPILQLRSVSSPDRLATLFRRLAAAEPRARATLVVTQAAVAVVALLGLAGTTVGPA